MSKTQLQSLQNAITSKPPFCSGTIPVSSDDLNLFYTSANDTRCLYFPTATASQLKHLYESCDPATFGRNKEDVLDEAYRKAGKLDADKFATSFGLSGSGLLQMLSDRLVDGQNADAILRAERYKINVYGKDAFFKPHKDTPRGENMFGSLVLVFPTKHRGGALILRDKGQEWTFDSAIAIQSQKGAPCVAYAAFYSDVEHEVAKVTSGYRITLTYNLYRVPPTTAMRSLKETQSSFEVVLTELLLDRSFLPKGGSIGFGLEREYPLPQVESPTDLERYKNLLKGTDAELLQVADRFGLTVSLALWYEADNEDFNGVLCEVIPPNADCTIDDGETYYEYLLDSLDGRRVNSLHDDDVSDSASQVSSTSSSNSGDEAPLKMYWVTQPTDQGAHRSTYIALGNGAELAWEYGHLCLIMEVGAHRRRQTAIVSQ